MPTPAATVATRAQTTAQVVRALREALAKVVRPSAALIFVSGDLARQLETLARAARDAITGLPMLLVSGAGVLTGDGELERESAAAVLVWSGGRASIRAFELEGDRLYHGVAEWTSGRGQGSRALLLFLRSEAVAKRGHEPPRIAANCPVIGGGSVGAPGLCGLTQDGAIISSDALGLLVEGLAPPVVASSPACRLLMPLGTVTEVSGPMLLRIDDKPALDVLGSVGQSAKNQPLIFAVLAPGGPLAEPVGRRPELLVRAVHGVDPIRRGLMISDELRKGQRVAFAIRDGQAARADLESTAREVHRQLHGAAARFGLYINCAGRGSALYGAADVDTRILRERFGEMPLLGISSAFEIAPYAGEAVIQLYTGVLAVFASPS